MKSSVQPVKFRIQIGSLTKDSLTYGTDYTIETATDETGKEYNAVVLKGGITQLYSVVTPISKTN